MTNECAWWVDGEWSECETYKETMVNVITEYWWKLGGMNETTNIVNDMPELCNERKALDGVNAEICCEEIENEILNTRMRNQLVRKFNLP